MAKVIVNAKLSISDDLVESISSHRMQGVINNYNFIPIMYHQYIGNDIYFDKKNIPVGTILIDSWLFRVWDNKATEHSHSGFYHMIHKDSHKVYRCNQYSRMWNHDFDLEYVKLHPEYKS